MLVEKSNHLKLVYLLGLGFWSLLVKWLELQWYGVLRIISVSSQLEKLPLGRIFFHGFYIGWVRGILICDNFHSLWKWTLWWHVTSCAKNYCTTWVGLGVHSLSWARLLFPKVRMQSILLSSLYISFCGIFDLEINTKDPKLVLGDPLEMSTTNRWRSRISSNPFYLGNSGGCLALTIKLTHSNEEIIWIIDSFLQQRECQPILLILIMNSPFILYSKLKARGLE